MTNPNDAQNLLMGGGARSWSWAVAQPNGTYADKPEGTSLTGTVDASGITEQQQTKIGTGDPETWPDGKPKMQIIIPLQTQFHDDDDDDGIRSLWVKQSSNLQAAIRDAVKASGAKALADGGQLTVTFTGKRASQTAGFNPVKLFSASYTPPAPQGSATLMDGQVQQVQAPAAPAPQAAAQPQQAIAIPPETIAVVRGLLGMQKTPAEVAAVTGLTEAQINQLPPF